MKKFNLLACILAVALLLATVFAVSAFADESTAPEISIESYNVAFSGELHLFYAVNTSLANNPAKVGVKVSYSSADEEGREVFDAKSSTAKYAPNPDYPTFYSFGIPAKRLTDVVYATPYAEYADGSIVYGDEVAYSVLEYCYEMILDDAPAKLLAGEITAKKCTDLQNSLRYLLGYGENVQKYFEWNTDSLPSDYYYIAADDSELNSSEGNIFVHKSELPESPTLVHTGTAPAGKTFVGWKVTYLDGTTDNLLTYTTEKHETSKLVCGVVENNTSVVPFTTASYAPLYLELPKGTANFDAIDPYSDAINHTNSNAESIFKLTAGIADPENAANRVLEAKFNSSAYGSSSTAAYTNVTRSDTIGGEPDVMNSAYTFGGDFYISSEQPNVPEASQILPSGRMFRFSFFTGANVQKGILNFHMEDSKLVVKYESNAAFVLATDISYDEWFSVEVVLNKYYEGETSIATMKIVITDADGNEYVGTIADSEIYSRARETVRIKDARIFWPGTGVNRRIFADNLSFVKTVGEYDTTITVTTNNTVE